MRVTITNKRKHIICAAIGVCAAALLTGGIISMRVQTVEAAVSRTQQELAEEVLRFHVLANSDSKEDQELKLKVRDAVIGYMQSDMPKDKDAETTAATTKEWAREHLAEITGTAEKVIAGEGYSYGVESEVTTCYFPEKTYGDITFPEGEYEALRIEIGSAKGHNWWCVLYPNLCFVDATHAVVSEEGKEELEHVLTDEEYEMVTATSDFKIKWFFFGDKTKE